MVPVKRAERFLENTKKPTNEIHVVEMKKKKKTPRVLVLITSTRFVRNFVNDKNFDGSLIQ